MAKTFNRGSAGWISADHPKYKWVALSNTTLGMLMATINSSVVLIALPQIFNGIKLDPLASGSVSYLLWIMMGFMLVSAVLVTTFGRLGDIYGRVKIYNLGFVIFTIGSIALAFDPFMHGAGAMWLILWRVVQGIGGSMLFANSSAIITDAFPADKRGMALGINQVAAIAGSFLGLVIGGLLAVVDWRAVFFVSVPFGIIGTIWSYKSLHETGTASKDAKLDIPGNLTFGIGLFALLVAITYGIQPYGGSSTGWGNPWVIAGIVGGLALLVVFVFIELRTTSPMFEMRLFKIRPYAMANLAGLLASIGRGGMQFMLIIWLQGIWLPLHGYSYDSTPLWAGIYLLPLTIGFLVAGPVCGALSDRYGARWFSTTGMLIVAATFVALLMIPVNFSYGWFVLITFLNGVGSGMFSAPNRTAIMNSVPADQRGSASGMAGTVLNGGSSLSIGIFFSLMVAGLSNSLPSVLKNGLVSNLPNTQPMHDAAGAIANAPGTGLGSLFSAFLGYNPIQTMLNAVHVTVGKDNPLLGKEFFPKLISGPFHDGLVEVFVAAAIMSVIAAIASYVIGGHFVHEGDSLDEAEKVAV